MEIQTSDEAYTIYRKLKDREEIVEKKNRGMNLLNWKKDSPFFISVMKEVSINLARMSDKIVVDTNLCSCYGRTSNIKSFFSDLENYLSIPYYKPFIQNARRQENKASIYSCDLSLRENDFEFSDIKIEIGELAEEELKKLGIDFCADVKKIVSKKRIATIEEEKDFERASYLAQRIRDLERQLGKRAYSYSSSYGNYGDNKDETIPIKISAEEYNQKLREVETELKQFSKKYPFLKIPTMTFVKIKVVVTLEVWKEKNKLALEESWKNLDEDEKEEYENKFEAYIENCFNESDGEDYSEDEDEEDIEEPDLNNANDDDDEDDEEEDY
jgi:hypothetical protein